MAGMIDIRIAEKLDENGEVVYATTKGYRTKVPGLVIRRIERVHYKPEWRITHEPSGYSAQGSQWDFRTLQSARQAVEHPDVLAVDWTRDREALQGDTAARDAAKTLTWLARAS